MNSLLIGIINLVVEFFSILILIEVIASWVAVANVRLPDTIVGLLQVISSITGIILNPIRRLIPSLGGLDISPIIALLLLSVVRQMLVGLLR
jgi:YggT family protein